MISKAPETRMNTGFFPVEMARDTGLIRISQFQYTVRTFLNDKQKLSCWMGHSTGRFLLVLFFQNTHVTQTIKRSGKGI